VTIHAWCTSSKFAKAGSITISFVVGWFNAITLMVPTLASLLPNTEYILTSSAEEYYAPPAYNITNGAPPTSVFDDIIFLNGDA